MTELEKKIEDAIWVGEANYLKGRKRQGLLRI